MKKLKLVILATALSVTTVGVFAGRATFVAQDVYVDVNGVQIKISNSTLSDELRTTQPAGGVQAKIRSSLGNGVLYDMYALDGTTKVPLYTQSF